MTTGPKTFLYKRSLFSTHLPVDYRYTRSHQWAKSLEDGKLRFGYTQFGTRMLGEVVDYNFETSSQAAVQPGHVLGWVEGFKAVSELICNARGIFAGANPALRDDTELISRTPYTEGWLYEIMGELDEETLDVQDYVKHLDITIESLLEQNKTDPRQ